MAKVQRDDVRAFGELYDRYCGQAYELAISACANVDSAEEVVHAAFISMWRNRASYHEQAGSVAAWLLTAVLDSARVTPHARSPVDPDDELHPPPGTRRDPAPDQQAADPHRMRTLLGRLPDTEREIISLALCGGLTYGEIAARLQLPAETVKGRMRLGLEQIRTDTEWEVA